MLASFVMYAALIEPGKVETQVFGNPKENLLVSQWGTSVMEIMEKAH